MFKRRFFVLLLLSIGIISFSLACVNNQFSLTFAGDYYANVDLSDKDKLYDSLHNIINTGWVSCSYSSLTKKLEVTDYDTQGLDDPQRPIRTVDMYSNYSYFQPEDHGSASGEGTAWNKEHLIPKSWWGGKDNGPNYEGGDAFNMFPVDGAINNMRSNFPFGEVDTVTSASKNNFSLKGNGKKETGYTKTVFEPNDKYKGDIARAYFYFATKNNSGNAYTKNEGSVIFCSDKFMLTDYARELFLKWHKLDPVSEWEKQRCENVYAIQKNRNPFIDHPEWAEIIWGDSPEALILNKRDLSLAKGDSFTLVATVLPEDAKYSGITWESSNPSVATVNDAGLVNAISDGNATITATISGSTISASCVTNVGSASNNNALIIGLSVGGSILAVILITATVVIILKKKKNK